MNSMRFAEILSKSAAIQPNLVGMIQELLIESHRDYEDSIQSNRNSCIQQLISVYFIFLLLFSSKCEMKFQPTAKNPIEYNYGPRSVAVGDFNNDTWLDMVVANNIVNNIAIYLGYGNGTFSSLIMYSTGSGSTPYMVAVGDFNNDHQLDIAVANFGTNNIGIFLGFGNGSFANHTETFNWLISSNLD